MKILFFLTLVLLTAGSCTSRVRSGIDAYAASLVRAGIPAATRIIRPEDRLRYYRDALKRYREACRREGEPFTDEDLVHFRRRIRPLYNL